MSSYPYCSENRSVNLLARLTIAEGYSNNVIVLSEYLSELRPSVETIGAVLVTSGGCTLIDTTIAANISIRTNQSEGYSFFVIGIYFDIVLILIVCF